MRRQPALTRNFPAENRTNRDIPWSELLDRESREKPANRKTRQSSEAFANMKESSDKNTRVNNLQKQFEELKNKIKHVEAKNDQMLTKLKSFKEQQRERSRSRTNNSIHRGDQSQSSFLQPITPTSQPPPRNQNYMSFGLQQERPELNFFQAAERDQVRQDQLYEQYLNLKENAQFLKIQLEKSNKALANRAEMYSEKEVYYKQIINQKDQQIKNLKEPRNKYELRRILDSFRINDKMNVEMKETVQKRLRNMEDRLGRVSKLMRLCEKSLRDQRMSRSAKRADPDVQFYSLKEKKFQNIIDQLEKDNQKIRQQKTEATKELQEIRSRFDSVKDSHEEELKELRVKYTSRMSAIEKKYTDELKLTSQQNSQLKQERDELQKLYQEEKQSNKKLKKQLEEKEDRVKKASSRQTSELDSIKSELTQLKDQLEVALLQRDELKIEIERITSTKSVKQSDLLSTQRNVKLQLNNEIKRLKLDIERLDIELSSLKRENWEANLKLKKKDQFKNELEETYKQKLQEEAQAALTARQERRKAEIELVELKNNSVAQQSRLQRISRQILHEAQLLVALESDNEIALKPLLEAYKNTPLELAVEIIRLTTDRRKIQAEDREKILRMIDNRIQIVGTRRLQLQVVEQLNQLLGLITTEMKIKQQALQENHTKAKWQKDLLEQQVSKLKKSNEQLKRQREKDQLERRSRKSQIQIKEQFEEEYRQRYEELRSMILQSETDKKQLQKQLKLYEFEQSQAYETYGEEKAEWKKRDQEKSHIIREMQDRLCEQTQKIQALQSQIRELKQELSKKKREHIAELRKMEYQSGEKISELEQDLQNQLSIKDQQINSLTAQINSLNTVMGQQKNKMSKDFNDLEKLTREKSLKIEDQLRLKNNKIEELIRDIKTRQKTIETLEKKLEDAQSNMKRTQKQYQTIEKLKKLESDEFEEKLKLKKQSQEMLTRRLELKNGEAARYLQEAKDLKEKLLQLTAKKQEVSALEDKLIQKQTKIMSLEEKVRELETMKKSLEERDVEVFQSNQLTLKRMEGYSKSLEEQLAAAELQIQRLKTNIHQKQLQLSKNGNELQNIKHQLEERNLQFNQLKQLYEGSIGNNEGLKKEAQQYSLMLAATKEKQVEILQLREKLQNAEKDNEKIVQNHQNQIKVLREQLTNLRTKLSEVESKSELDQLTIRKLKEKKEQIGSIRQICQANDNATFFSIGQEEPKSTRKKEQLSEGQLREFFCRIKVEIEKVLNQQEISVQIFQILPGELENDFQQLINVIRGRVAELTEQIQAQQLSFIYVDQQEEAYFGDSFIQEFPELAVGGTHEVQELRERVQEQARVIHNLTSEKEQHEMTITQMQQEKEEADEQNQTRHITQQTVMKRELREHKDRIDSLETQLNAAKKSLFKILQILLSEAKDLEQDYKEQLDYFLKAVRLTQKQKLQVEAYREKYVQKAPTKNKKGWFG